MSIKEIVDGRERVEDPEGPCHMCTLDVEPGDEAVYVTVEAPGTRWHGQRRVYHADCFIEDDE